MKIESNLDIQKNINKNSLKQLKADITRFMMQYKFALDEMNTKIDILKQEFQYMHDYNPIEHVKSRLKTPESIVKKVHKRGYDLSLSSIKTNVQDIAGIRITCSFISDIYKLSEMLYKQKDITLIECKDYIKSPKPNGYQSLHLILQLPIFMSDREEQVCVEVQIRTIAMDFWASLEHKIYYKYNKEVPQKLVDELREAAHSASELDRKMESLHQEMNHLKESNNVDEWQDLLIDNERFRLPYDLLSTYMNSSK